MKLALEFRSELYGPWDPAKNAVVEQFDRMMAQITASWNVQHKSDDTHGAVTVDSLTIGTLATTGVPGTVRYGVYTPALTGLVNVTAATAYPTGYVQFGAAVGVFGRADVQAVGAGATTLQISLPVAAVVSGEQFGGSFNSPGIPGAVIPYGAGNSAQAFYNAIGAGNTGFWFLFFYRLV